MKCWSDTRITRTTIDGQARTRRCASRIRTLLCSAFIAGCSTLPPSVEMPADLTASVNLYGAEVAALRELRVIEPVPAGIQSESELRASMQSLLIEEWSSDDDAVEAAYKVFGLIPKQMDLKQYLIEFYTGQVAGYYDPKRGSFFIKSDDASPSGDADDDSNEDGDRQFVIAHEFAHALQDQHFDLDAIDERFKGEADRATAVQALTEGDAMLAGLDHLVWRMGLPLSSVSPIGRIATRLVGLSAASGVGASDDPQAEQLRTAPEVISTNLTFPYVEGMAFASALRSELGQAGLDAAFRDPPDSTEQILYPERYLDRRDRPVQIELAPPPAGWGSSRPQTLGMLDLRVLLRTFASGDSAAEGWDGDRFALWEIDGAEPLLAWVTVWDSIAQARRFERAYTRALQKKRGDDRFAVVRQDDVVSVIEGAEPSDALFWATGLLESRITRDPRDKPPLSALARIARWPASYAQLDRALEVSALGGRLTRLRLHDGGYSFSLVNGLALLLERTPDRSAASTALGLLWTSSDRLHAYRAATIPGLLSFQRRGSGEDARFELHLGQTLILPSVIRWRSEPDATRVSLFGIIATAFGPEIPRGERVKLFFGWLPLPI